MAQLMHGLYILLPVACVVIALGLTHLNCKSALIGSESTFVANENVPVRAALAFLANPCVSPVHKNTIS